MGVIRHSHETRPIRIEDCEQYNYADYDLTESDVESVASVRVVAAASRSQKKKECRESRRLRRFHDALDRDGLPRVHKHMGARKWRRVENAHLLLAMVDKNDIVDDFSDILDRTMSAFDELFSDSAKMAVWNDFIERDEVEQERLLNEARDITRGEKSKPGSWFTVGGRKEHRSNKRAREHDIGEEEEGEGEKRVDKRQHHPAYSATSCFARLDRKLRGFLSERNLPWALIDRADRELRDFFNDTPDATWTRTIEGSRNRMAVHGIAQFLMLHSRTKDGETMKIHNARPYFVPPHTLLIPYLATRRRYPIHFVPSSYWPGDKDAHEVKTTAADAIKVEGGDVTDDSASSLDTSLEIIEEEECCPSP